MPSRGSPRHSPDGEAGGAGRECRGSALLQGRKQVGRDIASARNLPVRRVQRMEAGVILGWSESGLPPNSFGLFWGNGKGTVKDDYGRFKKQKQKPKSSSIRSSERGERDAERFSPQTSVSTPPRVFRSPGTEGGVGRGGVEKTGSGPAGAVGDPGMQGFRVRAGWDGERNPDPMTCPSPAA